MSIWGSLTHSLTHCTHIYELEAAKCTARATDDMHFMQPAINVIEIGFGGFCLIDPRRSRLQCPLADSAFACAQSLFLFSFNLHMENSPRPTSVALDKNIILAMKASRLEAS